MTKQQINLINLQELLKGRDYREIPKEEQLEIAKKLIQMIFPDSTENKKNKDNIK